MYVFVEMGNTTKMPMRMLHLRPSKVDKLKFQEQESWYAR